MGAYKSFSHLGDELSKNTGHPQMMNIAAAFLFEGKSSGATSELKYEQHSCSAATEVLYRMPNGLRDVSVWARTMAYSRSAYTLGKFGKKK